MVRLHEIADAGYRDLFDADVKGFFDQIPHPAELIGRHLLYRSNCEIFSTRRA